MSISGQMSIGGRMSVMSISERAKRRRAGGQSPGPGDLRRASADEHHRSPARASAGHQLAGR